MKVQCRASIVIHVCQECYIVPFMLLIHSILFVLSKKKKGEQTIEEGTSACHCRFLHSMQSLNPNISCLCWRKGKQKKEELCCGIDLAKAIRHSQGKHLAVFPPLCVCTPYV